MQAGFIKAAKYPGGNKSIHWVVCAACSMSLVIDANSPLLAWAFFCAEIYLIAAITAWGLKKYLGEDKIKPFWEQIGNDDSDKQEKINAVRIDDLNQSELPKKALAAACLLNLSYMSPKQQQQAQNNIKNIVSGWQKIPLLPSITVYEKEKSCVIVIRGTVFISCIRMFINEFWGGAHSQSISGVMLDLFELASTALGGLFPWSYRLSAARYVVMKHLKTNKYKYSSVTLVGHSMGANIGAMMLPEIKGYCGNSTSIGFDSPGIKHRIAAYYSRSEKDLEKTENDIIIIGNTQSLVMSYGQQVGKVHRINATNFEKRKGTLLTKTIATHSIVYILNELCKPESTAEIDLDGCKKISRGMLVEFVLNWWREERSEAIGTLPEDSVVPILCQHR